MLIEDFLSVENFYFLFTYLQDYSREQLNYDFEFNDKNKNMIGKLMELIYENNFNTLDKKTANALIINEIKQILKKRSHKEFLDTEKLDVFEIQNSQQQPFIDYNKPNQIMSEKFNSIFKKQAKEIDNHFIVLQENEPKELFTDVIQNLKFKEHDLSKAPNNIREDFLIPLPDMFKGLFDKPQYIENVHILLDSRDRNYDIYPDTYNYTIKLDSVLKNVISIEMMQINIPNSEYLINNKNNTIYFQETSGNTLIATINNGNYISGSDIATALQNSMNSIGDSNYTVSYDNLTKKFTISSDRTGGDGLFLLKFKGNNKVFGSNEITRTTYLPNSIGFILGFNKTDLGNKPFHISQNEANLTSDRSIYMFINADSVNSFENVESLKKHNFGKFMKLPLTSEFGEYTYWVNPRVTIPNLSDMYKTNPEQIIPEKSEMEIINKYENDFKLFFDSPITIDKLTLQFKNYNDDFFDFHGLEHSILFRIEMFNFHYENIIMDYKFPDFNEPSESINVDDLHPQLGNVLPDDTPLENMILSYPELSGNELAPLDNDGTNK